MFPSLLALLLLVLEPVPAVVVGSIIARLVGVVAVYLVMKESGWITALVTAAVSALAAFQLEAYAWGAYPQIMGMGFGLLATYHAIRFCVRAELRDAVIALLSTTATVLTHVLILAGLVVAVAVAGVYCLSVSPVLRENWRRSLSLLTIVVATCGVALMAGVFGGEGGVMNPAGLGLVEGFRLAMGESMVPWFVITGIGAVSVFHRRWQTDAFLSVATGLGWFAVGGVLFLVTGERRSLLLAQVGVLVLAGTELRRWWTKTQDAERNRRTGALLALCAGLVGSITVPGIAQYRAATNFYRVVSREEVTILNGLSELAEEGDVVVASRGRNVVPIGWWIEGVSRLPAISGHDPRFLTFPTEVEEAELANAFFEGRLDREATNDFLDSVDARFIVVDRRGPDGGWMFRADRPTFDVVIDSPTLVVLRVREPSATRGSEPSPLL